MRAHQNGPAARGQTLVLFALSLLLLTLMVLMTLSIGTKVKEKMELQTLADTAAYSNAVSTARTFNLFSTLNRVGIAHLVGAISTQSLISWSTAFYHSVKAVKNGYDDLHTAWAAAMALTCCNLVVTTCCVCGNAGLLELDARSIKTDGELAVLKGMFGPLDVAAATQVGMMIRAADQVYDFQLVAFARLRTRLNGQSQASDLIDKARPGTKWNAELAAPGKYDKVALNAVGLNPATSAVEVLNPSWDHHAAAVMGTRTHPFTTMRVNVPPWAPWVLMETQLNVPRVTTPPDLVVVTPYPTTTGSGYLQFGPPPGHSQFTKMLPWVNYFNADDHGHLVLTYAGVPSTTPPCTAFPKIMPEDFDASVGTGTVGVHNGSPIPGDGALHSIGPWLALSTYPRFIDYNPIHVVEPGHNFGQPKNFAVITRDYTQRGWLSPTLANADPWNPFFRFQLATASAGTTFDGRGVNVNGVDISQQMAMATGVTYYHRGEGHFKEPPNFFNPFWRAGLTRPNIDDQGLDDASGKTLDGPAKDAFDNLRAVGFKGWQ